MQPNYIQAILPAPHTVLGVRLLPLSLGHWVFGNRFDCAFLKGEIPNERDLLLGIQICSRTWAENCLFFSRPDWEKDVTRWGESVLGMNRLRRFFRLKPKQIAWAEKVRLFNAYLEEGMIVPDTIPIKTENSRMSTSPWPELLIYSAMQQQPGITREQVLDMPLTWAKFQQSTKSEIEGLCRYKSDGEREAETDAELRIRYTREIEEELAAKGGASCG